MTDQQHPSQGASCLVRDRRAGMTDDEFWADVYPGHTPPPDSGADLDDEAVDYGPDGDVPVSEPCPECGEPGACAWDAEGRPLIHAVRRPEEAGR